MLVLTVCTSASIRQGSVPFPSVCDVLKALGLSTPNPMPPPIYMLPYVARSLNAEIATSRIVMQFKILGEHTVYKSNTGNNSAASQV